MITRELTPDKKDWFSMKNDIFKAGDILIIRERITHPSGKVLCEPEDHLIVIGADCCGCFVQNKTRPELNFKVPENCPKGEEWLYDCWSLSDVSATLVRE